MLLPRRCRFTLSSSYFQSHLLIEEAFSPILSFYVLILPLLMRSPLVLSDLIWLFICLNIYCSNEIHLVDGMILFHIIFVLLQTPTTLLQFMLLLINLTSLLKNRNTKPRYLSCLHLAFCTTLPFTLTSPFILPTGS